MNIEELNKQAKLLQKESRKNSKKFHINLEKAKEVTRLALSQNPRHEISLIIMGTLLCDSNQPLEAIEYLKLAIDGGSEDHNAYYNLAVALVNIAPVEEVRKYMDLANTKKSNPATWQAYFDGMGN